jgi:hypothetical protein
VKFASALVYVVCDEKRRYYPGDRQDISGDKEQFDTAGFEGEEPTTKQEKKERREIQLFAEEVILARGGIEALEYDLGGTCRWFARIGRIQIPARRGGRILAQHADVSPLVDRWVADGSPRELSWRQKEVELYRAVEEGILRALTRGQVVPEDYSLDHISPRLSEVPNILGRLDANEVITVDITATVGFIFTEGVELCVGHEDHEYKLSIWREKAGYEFKVRVEVQGEEPARPH